ncbi:hypothetical protein [Phreatobacter sp.]|uniref:hypothetical protein n=1 Tax=Phreatobacter sp. TaxID=1966341 RepID=UPI003F6EB46F
MRPEPTPRPPLAVSTPAEAAELIDRLAGTMADLTRLLAEESALVRAVKLTEARPLERRKAELSQLYLADLARLKANGAYIRRAAGARIDGLMRSNEALQKALEYNLAILATAHAVSEGVIRSVSTAIQSKRAPATYGANGRTNAPPARAAAPVAISRQL